MFADLVDRTDVRVIKRRGRPRLALESLEHVRVAGQLFWQELQSHLPPKLQILGFKHLSHAAFPQKANDLESAGHDCAGAKEVELVSASLIVMLKDRLTQEAARLLMI